MLAAAAFPLLLIFLFASFGSSQVDNAVTDSRPVSFDASQITSTAPASGAPITASPSVAQIISPTTPASNFLSLAPVAIEVPPTPAPVVSSLSSSVTRTSPAPVPTLGSFANQTDDYTSFFPEFLEVGAVVTLTFTGNSTWNESNVEQVSMEIQSILEGAWIFTGVPLSVAVVPNGEPSKNSAGEVSVEIYAEVSIPWADMGFIDGYTLQLLVDQILSESKFEAFEANGVQVIVEVILTPPTSAPTYAPTTAEAYRQMKKTMRVRSLIFVSIFWVIIILCFSLENGLCAFRNWRKDEDKAEYDSVGLGHLD